MATKMTHASLFSGIGGFEVAADWAGFENLFNCEIDPFCRAVLHYHYPNAIQYVDIRNTDFIPWRGRIDVLTGGFPCQPFSIAGKRKGTEDNRYLWPQMLRAIHEIRPGWVVGENVLGIVNWSQGLVFEQVCADLEIEGYEVQPYILPACGVDAPHQRYRTWFVAHLCSNTKREGDRGSHQTGVSQSIIANSDNVRCTELIDAAFTNQAQQSCRGVSTGNVADTDGKRCNNGQHNRSKRPLHSQCVGTSEENQRPRDRRRCKFGSIECNEFTSSPSGTGNSELSYAREQWRLDNSYQMLHTIPDWDNFPTQSPVCRGDDGLSEWLDPAAVFKGCTERKHRGDVAVRWRTQAIKCYGNAIVPQVFYHIISTIREIERLEKSDNFAYNL
ncbi:DNA cytosine methyltransferase [Alistipes onderdonkii]|mgnify:FL=1|uniref:DNA cytosine methyltransferase n=1 Tax=Alistipes onderdonkii TaxID=328813 RepID=UPI001FB9AC24|nr:DNA cytosine methyltransferase [Alistipes onderdonkii]